jgi:hypothetical protein
MLAVFVKLLKLWSLRVGLDVLLVMKQYSLLESQTMDYLVSVNLKFSNGQIRLENVPAQRFPKFLSENHLFALNARILQL